MAVFKRVAGVTVIVALLLIMFAAGWVVAKTGMGATIDPATLPAVERAFVEKMTNTALVGRFTMRGREDRAATPDRYDIYSVDKVGENQWRFNAKIGEYGITLPIVVTMKFVDDTPMIVMTDASIPGVGAGFSARVLFHGDTYAGTWGHGEAGGHMFGRIERGAAQQ